MAKMPKSLEAIKQLNRVAEVSYEPHERQLEPLGENGAMINSGAVYWAYLAKGWCNGEQGFHTVNGGTIAEVRAQIAQADECLCDECQA